MEQLEPQPQLQLPEKHLWVDYVEEDDEEEVGVGLLARSSRLPTNGVGATPTSAGELQPVPDSAPTNGTSFEHFEEEEDEEEEAAAPTADNSNRNEEAGDVKAEDKAVKGEGGGTGNSVYFDKLQGTECINGISEMQSEILKIPRMEVSHQQVKIVEDQNSFGLSSALIERLHKETNTSFKHFENATKLDANIDLVGEIEEDFLELDVEQVLEKQNTHDLYCPNCNSCITRRVILRRRKPQISSIRRKPKHKKKLDAIPNSVGGGLSGDKPETSLDVSPTAAPNEQTNGTEQDQEAFSCLSCFSLFIPIGNGCFKIFQFFRQGRQNEHTQSPQEISQREKTQSPQEIGQRENIQSPQGINPIKNTQSPQEISQKEKTQSLQGMSQGENIQIPQAINPIESTQSPQEISQKEETQNLQRMSQDESTETPQKRSRNEDTHSPRHINHNEDAQNPQNISRNEDGLSPQKISRNEDRQIPQKISLNENTQSLQDINRNENKQSPQKIPTAKTNWIFSIFAFNKSKATLEKAGHALTVQSAAVPTPSITNGEHIDDGAISAKERGTSNIFSSTNSSRLDKVKPESRENEADADMFQRNAGDNEVEDIEAGLPRTEVAPSLQSRTQIERRSADTGEAHEWEILKSIVYGGLIESITSLGVVSSAAGAGADTVNVLALGLANLIGGLLIIGHNLRELKNDQPQGASTEINIEEDRYQVLLGRRQNFALHATVAILSFLIFGLIPPVVYGFSFRESDDKDLKLAAVAGASFVCIVLLALGKGHVRKPQRTYFRTVSYYVILGIMASGISYLVGELIKKLLEQLGLFESISAVSVPFLETVPLEVGRASF